MCEGVDQTVFVFNANQLLLRGHGSVHLFLLSLYFVQLLVSEDMIKFITCLQGSLHL